MATIPHRTPMLLVDTGPLDVVVIVVTSLIGLFGVAAALNGTLFCRISPLFRVLMAAGGLSMMFPGFASDIIGLVLVLGVVVLQKLGAQKAAA